jgi:hypothetical protein
VSGEREDETFTEAEWEGLLWCLKGRAEYLASRFGAPVHLVGSALNWRERAPRDIDIRIVLPDADWEARFGGNSLHFNAECSPVYVAEVGKLTRQLVRDLRRNIDLQVQPENWLTRHNAHAKPRLLLADCPAAALSQAGEADDKARKRLARVAAYTVCDDGCDQLASKENPCNCGREDALNALRERLAATHPGASHA